MHGWLHEVVAGQCVSVATKDDGIALALLWMHSELW